MALCLLVYYIIIYEIYISPKFSCTNRHNYDIIFSAIYYLYVKAVDQQIKY